MPCDEHSRPDSFAVVRSLSAAYIFLSFQKTYIYRVSTLDASQVPVADWLARLPPTIADSILDRIIYNSFRLNLTRGSQRKRRSPIPIPAT